MQSMAFVELEKQSDKDLAQFREYADQFTEIRECYLISGSAVCIEMHCKRLKPSTLL